MNFNLDEKYLTIQARALELAREIEPMAVEADASNVVHQGVLEALKASGLSRLMVAAEYGGTYETIDPLAICVVREAMMATSSHLDSLFALQGIGSYAITVAGSQQQREQWLPKVAATEALGALALTEDNSGSDLKSVSTEVKETADGLVLNGSKAYISNAGAAAYYIVFAKEDSGFSTVLVPADSDGVSTLSLIHI